VPCCRLPVEFHHPSHHQQQVLQLGQQLLLLMQDLMQGQLDHLMMPVAHLCYWLHCWLQW
jgi:hypothetical protein